MAYCYNSSNPKPVLLPDGSLPGEATKAGAKGKLKAKAAAPATTAGPEAASAAKADSGSAAAGGGGGGAANGVKAAKKA
jgi:hypothetical protein